MARRQVPRQAPRQTSARTERRVEHPERECEVPECSRRFTPQRSTARFCSATCRQRAARARRAAEESVGADAAKGLAEHDLVKAVRLELEEAGKAMTFNGQLALQLARKLVNPDESGATALSKELRAVMGAALAGAPSSADPADSAGSTDPGTASDHAVEEDDEVKRAREARERKAREAAAR
ncbi:MAG: hypothetical protein QM638_01190 [Nocardioides sp.]|uniref:hypothetical protein n=1 Tax=Nocardioides sp. TaxID=35761 RepID=UPI0039E2AA24